MFKNLRENIEEKCIRTVRTIYERSETSPNNEKCLRIIKNRLEIFKKKNNDASERSKMTIVNYNTLDIIQETYLAIDDPNIHAIFKR